jgi:hypothetical protein
VGNPVSPHSLCHPERIEGSNLSASEPVPPFLAGGINTPLSMGESLSRFSSGMPGARLPQPSSFPPSEGPREVKQHVLLISSSLDNAARLLIPYKANLEHNPRITNDYGTQHNYGKWTATEFTTKRGISFRAVGADQPPRGAKNEKNVRPDIILFDDIDTDSDCRNPEMINKTWKWIEEAAISTRSISKATTIIFCGNRIAVDCCVVRACKFADHVDEINIVDENGNPTWPQKNSKESIERVLRQKSYASAQKEYFNNPVTEGAVFRQMNYKPMQALNAYNMLVCYTDPSYKDGPKNDYKATVLVGRWHDEFHIIKCFVEQASTAAMIDWHYQIMHYLNINQNTQLGRSPNLSRTAGGAGGNSQQHELLSTGTANCQLPTVDCQLLFYD